MQVQYKFYLQSSGKRFWYVYMARILCNLLISKLSFLYLMRRFCHECLSNSIPQNIELKICYYVGELQMCNPTAHMMFCKLITGIFCNICQQFDPCIPTPCLTAGNSDQEPVSSRVCLKWSQCICIVQTKYK